MFHFAEAAQSGTVSLEARRWGNCRIQHTVELWGISIKTLHIAQISLGTKKVMLIQIYVYTE